MSARRNKKKRLVGGENENIFYNNWAFDLIHWLFHNIETFEAVYARGKGPG